MLQSLSRRIAMFKQKNEKGVQHLTSIPSPFDKTLMNQSTVPGALFLYAATKFITTNLFTFYIRAYEHLVPSHL